jgi:hypothetical protein
MVFACEILARPPRLSLELALLKSPQSKGQRDCHLRVCLEEHLAVLVGVGIFVPITTENYLVRKLFDKEFRHLTSDIFAQQASVVLDDVLRDLKVLTVFSGGIHSLILKNFRAEASCKAINICVAHEACFWGRFEAPLV